MILTKPKKILIFVLIFLGVAAFWGFLVEPNLITARKIFIKNESTPDFLKEIKFLQISDLHIKNFGRREAKILEIINQNSPDFIFITGDIVDWETKNFAGTEEFFKKLSSGYRGKIYAVFGNHDHRNSKLNNLKNILSENDVVVLNNDSRKTTINGGNFYLVGVDDPHLGYDNITKALAKTDDSFKILLAHSPEIFRKASGKVDLVLVGHTHGCQVDLPGICDLIMPLDCDYKKYKKGLFEENSTHLYVSNGLGMTFLPLRFNAFPEVVLINLQ